MPPTSLDATLTLDGLYQIVARTPKGTGAYLVTMTKTAEGGLGTPSFGWTNDRTHLTTELRPDARLQAPLLDPFGNPVSGARVTWEEGSDCGMGDFCGNGTTVTERSSVDGAAVLDVQPAAGGDPLWRPATILGPAAKARPIGREGVRKRISQARSAEPFLGILRTSGTAVLSTDLPDLTTAKAITAEARRRATTSAHGDTATKDGPLCGEHSQTCGEEAPVFRAVQLSLDPGDDLVDLEVQILDGGAPTDALDGQTVLSDVSLTLEAVATVRDDQGVERQVSITDPISVAVSKGTGGAISDGAATCATVDVTPGPFTYKVGRNAAIHYVYDEPDGSPCCWQPTEALYATVVVDAEVDDGQGGTIRITRQAETMVESTPRPADPCEVRSWQGGVPEIASYDAYNLIEVGDVYLTDACGNIVHGVGLSDSENHDQPGDEFRITSPLDPPGEGVWATALSGNNQWSWSVRLHGNVGTPDTIPDGSYTIDLEIASASPECSAGGVITGSHTVSTTMGTPQVALWWDWIWDAENSPRGPNPEDALISPGSALRDRSGAVAMWRVPAFNDDVLDHFFEGGYADVPVKLYVAASTMSFDEDGNLDPTYLEPVEGVELCTGTVEKLADASGNIDYNSPVRTTCDTTWSTVTGELLASSDPPLTGHTPDTWVTMGLGVGITKGPEQPGSYLLVAEPIDETFRRGDAWMLRSSLVPDGYVGFEVGGGMFLDEDWQPVTDGFAVSEDMNAYFLYSQDGEGSPDVVITATDRDGQEVDRVESVQMTAAGGGTFISEAITLLPPWSQGSSKDLPAAGLHVSPEVGGLIGSVAAVTAAHAPTRIVGGPDIFIGSRNAEPFEVNFFFTVFSGTRIDYICSGSTCVCPDPAATCAFRVDPTTVNWTLTSPPTVARLEEEPPTGTPLEGIYVRGLRASASGPVTLEASWGGGSADMDLEILKPDDFECCDLGTCSRGTTGFDCHCTAPMGIAAADLRQNLADFPPIVVPQWELRHWIWDEILWIWRQFPSFGRPVTLASSEKCRSRSRPRQSLTCRALSRHNRWMCSAPMGIAGAEFRRSLADFDPVFMFRTTGHVGLFGVMPTAIAA